MGKSQQRRQEQLYGNLADTAQALNQEGAGYRSQAGNFYSSILSGGPNAQKVLAPAIGQLRNQYRIARESVDRFLPRGGARMGAYRSLAGSEAGDVGRLFSENLNQAVGNLQNLGVFGTQAGLGATQNAAQGYGQLAEQSMNRTFGGIKAAGKIAGLGMGV